MALCGFIPKNEHPSEPLHLIRAGSHQSAEGGAAPDDPGVWGEIPQRVMACAVGSGFGFWRWPGVVQGGCPHPMDLCAGSRAKKGWQKSKSALWVG